MSRGFDPLVKQMLDGERTIADLPPELHAEAAEALRLQSAIDRRDVSLSRGLEARVMAAVRARADSPARRAWRWLVAPSVPRWAIGALAAASLAALLIGRSSSNQPTPLMTASQPAESAYVKFVLYAPGAQRVAVAGTFNQWDAGATLLARAGDQGVWTVTVALPVGQHQYAFVVDGRRWVPDPAAPNVDDGFGRRNSIMSVTPTSGPAL
jgi:AMP-activated protein kinase-like protein